MPDVVQEYGCEGCGALGPGELVPLQVEGLQGHLHEMHGPDGVLKARVDSPGVH